MNAETHVSEDGTIDQVLGRSASLPGPRKYRPGGDREGATS